MTTVEQRQVVPLGGFARVDASLDIKSIEETIVVTAETSSVLTKSHVGANYEGDTVRTLPTPRTLAGIAELAPGLTNMTPNSSQVTIAGGYVLWGRPSPRRPVLLKAGFGSRADLERPTAIEQGHCRAGRSTVLGSA